MRSEVPASRHRAGFLVAVALDRVDDLEQVRAAALDEGGALWRLRLPGQAAAGVRAAEDGVGVVVVGRAARGRADSGHGDHTGDQLGAQQSR
ncbi:Uncharacterised protein [Mycobacteroides abscessus subsp. abscessus]|nr:Uncharacterised protein [Mycobacteroides abscessus subsp. abscessus]